MIMLEGKTPEAPTLADVLLDTHDAVDAIRGTRVDRLDILPADGRLANLTAHPRRKSSSAPGAASRRRAPVRRGRLRRLRGRLAAATLAPDRERPPGRVRGHRADDHGIFAIAGLGRLPATVDRVRALSPASSAWRYRVVADDPGDRQQTTRGLERQLRETSGSLVSRSVIPNSVTVEERPRQLPDRDGMAPRSAVAKAYDELVTEVLKHGRANEGSRETWFATWGTPREGELVDDQAVDRAGGTQAPPRPAPPTTTDAPRHGEREGPQPEDPGRGFPAG